MKYNGEDRKSLRRTVSEKIEPDGQTDGQTDIQTDRRTDRRTDIDDPNIYLRYIINQPIGYANIKIHEFFEFIVLH